MRRSWESVRKKEQESQNTGLTICGGRLESVAEALSVSVGFLNLLQGFCSSQLHQRPQLLHGYPEVVRVVGLHSSTPLWIELHRTVRHVAYGSCRWHCQLFSLWSHVFLPVQIYRTPWDSVSVAWNGGGGGRLNCDIFVLNLCLVWLNILAPLLSLPKQHLAI